AMELDLAGVTVGLALRRVEHGRRGLLRVVEGELERRDPAPRDAEDHGLLDTERVEQPREVAGVEAQVVLRGLSGAAESAVVPGDRAEVLGVPLQVFALEALA